MTVAPFRPELSQRKLNSADLLCPVEDVLNGALAADLESVVILGTNKDGSFFVAQSHGLSAVALTLMRATAIVAGQFDDV